MDTSVWLWVGLWAALFGSLAGVIATERGKTFLDGFVIGAIFGPFGVLWAYLRERSADGQSQTRQPCPHCAELILPAANICPFCRSHLEPR